MRLEDTLLGSTSDVIWLFGSIKIQTPESAKRSSPHSGLRGMYRGDQHQGPKMLNNRFCFLAEC